MDTKLILVIGPPEGGKTFIAQCLTEGFESQGRKVLSTCDLTIA